MSNERFTSSTSQLIESNAEFAERLHDPEVDVRPSRNLAIVACMDARMDMVQMLGLANGDAHLIRNAGGVITDDVIRSLCLSQRALGTREIVLVHHTDCGLQKVDEESFKAELEQELGVKPWWAIEGFSDPYADTRQSMQRLLLNPFIMHKDHITGFVYDVTTGLLNPVEAAPHTLEEASAQGTSTP